MGDMKTVLIIDDDRDYVSAITALLESAGYRAISANNGRDGLQEAKVHKPDVILLDVMMTERTEGFFTLQEIRRIPALRETPVIVVSSIYTDQPVFRVSPEAGWLPADVFLPKPVEPGAAAGGGAAADQRRLSEVQEPGRRRQEERMKILKIPKENLDLFVRVLPAFGEVYAPVKRGSGYAFDRPALVVRRRPRIPADHPAPQEAVASAAGDHVRVRSVQRVSATWLAEAAKPMVLFGVHAYDIYGLNILDRVFAEGKYPDPYYVTRRQNTRSSASTSRPTRSISRAR